MKLSATIEFDDVHAIMDKLANEKELQPREQRIVLKVLKTVQGHAFPSPEELAQQMKRIETLDKLHEVRNADRFNKILAECDVFEQKYC